mmetsp:Transcript_26640/g.56668  ORF Transcript_26640/g.56668 Transcript_26640/m.56668 type:complete len:102 (-) Transcript_26640:73-378(-)
MMANGGAALAGRGEDDVDMSKNNAPGNASVVKIRRRKSFRDTSPAGCGAHADAWLEPNEIQSIRVMNDAGRIIVHMYIFYFVEISLHFRGFSSGVDVTSWG